MSLHTIKEPNYFKINNEVNRPVNNKIPLHKDKEALAAFLVENVEPNIMTFGSTSEYINYLIENEYIEKEMIDKYSLDEIDELLTHIRNAKFAFKSFMAAYKFYNQYAMKTNDGSYYLETYNERVLFNALYFADGNIKLAYDLADEMIHQRYQPATPSFLNAGRKRRGELVSCFLLQVTDDMNSIGRVINSALQLSRIGGGVGITLSNLREAGAPIKGYKGAASGVVPVMKLLEDSFSYSNQLGQRQGAGVVYLNVFHPDIVAFLSTKRENADEKVRVKTLSLGIIVPDKFYELARKNQEMYMFSPYDVEREYGKPFSYVNITEEYDNLVNNPNITKTKIKARTLEDEISKLQQESGYPYIMNIDTVNKANPIMGDIVMSNLCVTGDTELLTSDGYIPAKELFESGKDLSVLVDDRTTDAKTYGLTAYNAIPMHLTAKQADVYEVKTKAGFSIKSTEWHKYYVQRGDEIVKLPLAEIKVHDKLLIQSGEGAYGINSDVELAYIMGLITGDGTMTKNAHGNSIARMYLYDEKSQYASDIETKIESIIKTYNGNRTYKHNAVYKPKFQNNGNKLTLSSTVLGRILDEDYNFNQDTKLDIPKYIKRGTKEVQAAYLSGLFKMNGCINTNKKAKTMAIELVSISNELAVGVQKLLINMGIYSTIYNRDSRIAMMPDGNGGSAEYQCKETYRVTIQDHEARELFMSIIEMKDKDIEKFNDFNTILSPVSRKPKHHYTSEITSIDFYGVEDVYDTTQEDFHSLIFNGIVTGNCSEILQIQTPSVINDAQEYEHVGIDISCNLGSTNIVNLMESPDFGKSVRTMTRALTYVTDTSDITSVPSVNNGNKQGHTIGLGAMGLHSFLAKNQIEYGSKESIEFIDIYFRLLNYWTLVESMNIAKERNTTFTNFKESKYYTGEYFKEYETESVNIESDKVRELFNGIHIPTTDDWKDLKNNIHKYGLYHQNRLAVAPNGSISYINDTSASLHPITRLIEERQEKKTGKIYYPAAHLTDDTLPYYKSAYDMDMRKVIDVYAAAQKHIDQGMSLTLFMRSDIPEGLYEWKTATTKQTTRDLNILRHYAHNKGIKTIYYVRTFTDDADEIGSNQCESCSI